MKDKTISIDVCPDIYRILRRDSRTYKKHGIDRSPDWVLYRYAILGIKLHDHIIPEENMNDRERLCHIMAEQKVDMDEMQEILEIDFDYMLKLMSNVKIKKVPISLLNRLSKEFYYEYDINWIKYGGCRKLPVGYR